MMTAFRIITLIVFVLSGFGSASGGSENYVNAFTASGTLFLVSYVIEALLQMNL